MQSERKEYVLHATRDLEEKVVDDAWLREDIASCAAEGSAMEYFMEELGPRLAPSHFLYSKWVFASYYQGRRASHGAFRDQFDHSIEVEAVMDTIQFIRVYEGYLGYVN
ncbi:hypothetical protein GF367_00175 [Candidatus Woesearchaeota archaeon]|nr:hypothetical protein [Candidatus Woesearchaeota archaeon]